MSVLLTKPNIARPDDVYELLINMHDGLSEAESALANSRLVLLLINHVGDEQVIREAIEAANPRVRHHYDQ